MYLRSLLFAVTVLIAADRRATAVDQAVAKPTEYSVKAVRAFLFYEELGRQDARDAADGKMALRNTIIGGGDAEAPSNTLVVLVDLEGPSFVTGTRGELTVTASAGTRTLRREQVDLGTFFTEGFRLSVPLVVHGTGCEPLDLSAELRTGKAQSVLKRTVPFNCGE